MTETQTTTVKVQGSKMIGGLGYKPDEKQDGLGKLFVEMTNGTLYEYEGVSQVKFHELLSASSKGKFFLSEIRDRYPSQKVR